MAEFTISEARARLTEVLDRVSNGEEITITRHGRAAAVVLRPDAVRVRRGRETVERAREVGALLDAARRQPLSRPGITAGRAEALAEDVRADRDRS